MTEQKHTPEPWAPTDQHIGYWAEYVGGPINDGVTLGRDDYERAQICVNACAEMEDPAKEIESLRAEVADLRQEIEDLHYDMVEERNRRDD